MWLDIKSEDEEIRQWWPSTFAGIQMCFCFCQMHLKWIHSSCHWSKSKLNLMPIDKDTIKHMWRGSEHEMEQGNSRQLRRVKASTRRLRCGRMWQVLRCASAERASEPTIWKNKEFVAAQLWVLMWGCYPDTESGYPSPHLWLNVIWVQGFTHIGEYFCMIMADILVYWYVFGILHSK